MIIPLEEYREFLESHDWYYNFSDDFDVYELGQKQFEKLEMISLEGGGEYKALYEEYYAKHFKISPFVEK